MSRNMGIFDRGMRAVVVAPAAIVAALGLGAGTVGGIILLVVAGIMPATAITGVLPAVCRRRDLDPPARTASRPPSPTRRSRLESATGRSKRERRVAGRMTESPTKDG